MYLYTHTCAFRDYNRIHGGFIKQPWHGCLHLFSFCMILLTFPFPLHTTSVLLVPFQLPTPEPCGPSVLSWFLCLFHVA